MYTREALAQIKPLRSLFGHSRELLQTLQFSSPAGWPLIVCDIPDTTQRTGERLP